MKERERERERKVLLTIKKVREELIDNQHVVQGRYAQRPQCRVTPPPGIRGPAYGGEKERVY